jgi:hypothetical protein
MKLPAHVSPVLLVLSLGLVLKPVAASAQVHAGVTWGISVPTFDPLVKEFGGVNGAPVPYPVLEKWQTGAFAMTGRALWSATSRFHVETALAYSPGLVATRDSLNGVRDDRAHLIMASIRLPILLASSKAPVRPHIAPGFVYSMRTGPAWSGFEGRGQPGGVISVGARAQLKPRSSFWFYLAMEDYFHWSRFGQRGGVSLTPQFHQTIVASVGILYQFIR